MIDAHVHVWQLGAHGCTWPTPELRAIHRDHLAGEASDTVRGAGLPQLMLVQSQEDEADTRWLMAEAAREPAVAGVVGWVDLCHDDAPVRLGALARDRALKGIRLMAQDRPADWLDDPRMEAGLRAMETLALSLDLLVRPQHLDAALRLATRHAGLSIVIDHLAKPPIAAGWSEGWVAAMTALAAQPHVFAKLSGLVTEMTPGQPLDALAPYVAVALELFGPDRVMWGSDWPVIKLAATYRDWLDFARAHVPSAHHAAVFGGTAAAFYRLDRAA